MPPSPDRPRVLIVILNWNSAEHTIQALKHACSQSYPSFEVLVIDNGSSDDSLAQLREAVRPPCRLLPLRTNLGFAAGVNIGLRDARRNRFAYAWLLNSDAFPAPECLPTLLRYMELNQAVVITGPRLLAPNGTEHHAGGRVSWYDGEPEYLPASALVSSPCPGTWLTGAAMLLRLAGLRQVGWFDPRFFAYWEDADLCTRVVRTGGDVRAVPEASCYHIGGASSGGWRRSRITQFLFVRNTWLFLYKHLRAADRPAVLLRFLAKQLARAGVLALNGRDESASTILAAVSAVLRREYGRPKRLEPSEWLKDLLLLHPWRVSRFLEDMAERLRTKNLHYYETLQKQDCCHRA